ncbi:MAG: tetratricopeptide repeat protein, partial [Myxococcota bacterium]
LLEQGILARENGRVVLTRDVSEINIPDSIQDVLMARIDRLAEEPKRAIQIASIIGREFALRLLERISEIGDQLDHVIDDLRALELIYEKAAHPELAFMFKHALTHDVAYQSVLLKRRKVLHRVVGHAMEELYRDRLAEHYDALAHHFGRAEEWDKALHYEELAGVKAAEGYANQAAAEHFRRALEIVKRLGEAVPAETARRLEVSLANACFYTSQFEAAGDAHMRAADLSADPETKAMSFADAAHEYLWGHKQKQAEKALENTVALSEKHNLAAPKAKALIIGGFFGAVLGDMDYFRDGLEEGTRVSGTSGNEEVSALISYLRGQHAEWTGDYRNAIAHSEKALAAGRKLRLAHLVVWPNWFIGKAYCCLGDYGKAIHHISDAHDLCERMGDRAWRTRLLNTLGWCFAEAGNLELAHAHNARAAVLAHEIGDPEIIANAEINLGGNRLAMGDPDGARSHLDPIFEMLDQRPPFQRWRYSLHLFDALGRVALAEGDPEKTLSFAEGESEKAGQHQAPKVRARALELRGRALVTMDRRAEAGTALAEALDLGKRIGYPPVQWRALSLLAEIARRGGDNAGADRLARAAKALVHNMAQSIPEPDLRNTFGAVGARLATDPLGAYR